MSDTKAPCPECGKMVRTAYAIRTATTKERGDIADAVERTHLVTCSQQRRVEDLALVRWPEGEPVLYIFDADGTLRRSTVEGQHYPRRPGEWELIPGVVERLAEIDWSVRRVGIVSNQGGIAAGFLDEVTAHRMLAETAFEALGRWLPEGAIRFCPHADNAGCGCRKPMPELLHGVMQTWGMTPEQTVFVGDLETDWRAAERAGCRFVWADDFFDRGPNPRDTRHALAVMAQAGILPHSTSPTS